MLRPVITPELSCDRNWRLDLVRPFPIMHVQVHQTAHDRLAAQVERFRAIGHRRRIPRAGAYDPAVSTSRCSTTTRCGLPAGATARRRSWARRRLSWHPAKTHVASTASPATFVGYELRPGRRRREANVRRFRNRLCGLRDRWGAGTVTRRELSSGFPLGGACGARRHVAAVPRDLPGRVVRPARTTGPGGLTGPRPPCVARLFLEQQREEPASRRAQRQPRRQSERQQRSSRVEHAPPPEPSRSRPWRGRTGASRAGHDEQGPPDKRRGVTAGARPGPQRRLAPAVVPDARPRELISSSEKSCATVTVMIQV